MWADGPADTGRPGDRGDVAVNASAVHAGAAAGPQQGPGGAAVDDGLDGAEGGMGTGAQVGL